MTGRPGTYDDIQAMFLIRLVRLKELRAAWRYRLPERDLRLRLIEAAFRSTLRDCEALGIEAEAHALLEND